MKRRGRHFDVIVIGAGLSGLAAANQLAETGTRVGLIAKGGGFLHFTSGCVDVLGRTSAGPVVDPVRGIDELVEQVSDHPYALAGRDHLTGGLQQFRDAMAAAHLPFEGDEHLNLFLPTAIGSTRTTCLAPRSMAGGNMGIHSPMLIVGLRGFRDFYPPYLAANLSRVASYSVRHLYLDVPGLQHRRRLLSTDVARALDDPAIRQTIARLVKSNLGNATRVGFPAVLGLDRSGEAFQHLSDLIGCPLFEVSTLPPSVAGIRINTAYRRRLLQAGVRVEIGFGVQGRLTGNWATELVVDSAGGATTHTAEAFILATGGTGGGGIAARQDGSLHESVFGLPVERSGGRSTWYKPHFLGPDPQPISLTGIPVNDHLQPVSATGSPIENVFVTASNLPGWDPVHEGSGEGVALATAHKAATEVLQMLGASRDRRARALVPEAPEHPRIPYNDPSRAASLDS